MKVARIFQFVLLVVIALYLLWLHSANQDFVNLPGLVDLPAAIVIATALLLGWLMGWLPTRLALWRKRREVTKLQKRVDALERRLPTYQTERYDDDPVIPDRAEERVVGPNYENL